MAVVFSPDRVSTLGHGLCRYHTSLASLYATFHILVSAEESLIGLVKMQILILTKA